MTKYFGTDGIRGEYKNSVVCEEFFEKLSKAVYAYLRDFLKIEKPVIVIGGDTRFSRENLTKAFCKNLGNAIVYDLQVAPTPAIAFAVKHFNANLGVVITASHNPYIDNGIKFFDKNAFKISDAAQEKIEELIDANLPENIFSGEKTFPNILDEYIKKMCSLLPINALANMNISLDCANGATYLTSPKVLEKLGAKVHCMGVNPDGRNINNNVGSECPQNLSKFCLENSSDIAIAHDGDGDRLVVCDSSGTPFAGEEILGLIAMSDSSSKNLGIVTTLQSNTGLDASLAKHSIKVFRCGIGDRLVSQTMQENACIIGGENSGHYIFSDISPCGDGLAGAIKFLSFYIKNKDSLSDLRKHISLFPTLSKAIKIKNKIPLEETKNLSKAISLCEKNLVDKGRILVRYSGTENKIRLLVEAQDSALTSKYMNILEQAVENDLQ